MAAVHRASSSRLPNWSDSEPRDYGHGMADGGDGPLRTANGRSAAGGLPRLGKLTRFLAIVGVFAFTMLFFTTFFPGFDSTMSRRTASGIIFQSHLDSLNVPAYVDDEGGKRRLRIFMPADGPALNLCKVIMSAVALGYPLPTVINWRGEFNRPEWHFAGSHIAKLEGLLAVFETLLQEDSSDDDVDERDLVLLVDAYDIWFQLPPSVLIERFYQLNREADERNRRQWEALASNFPILPPKQSIIVTTAKHCHPDWDSGSSPHYEHWPDSPLPSDFYGKDTDSTPLFADPARRYKRVRPRCVNSGMIMGTMGSLRDALQRCKEKVDTVFMNGRQLWSDQALFGEVIGDQELWREWMRGLAGSWNGTAAENRLSSLPSAVRAIAEEAIRDKRRFEFGIGLDYNFTTIPPTCSAEEDGFFVKANDKEALKRESEKAGVPDGVVRVQGIPRELEGKDGPIEGKKWEEVPLYTDFFFGLAPVGIHHNAYINNFKPFRLEHWWNMTWFYPHLRELVVKNLQPPSSNGEKPLAILPATRKGGKELKYYAPKDGEKGKTVTVFDEPSKKFVPIDWDGVCQKGGDTPWHEKLFGDGKGPLDL